MIRLATTLGAAALLLAPLAASAQTTFVNDAGDWTTNDATFGTGSTERGFAYGLVGGNHRIYVVSRKTGTRVNIYNADTGVFQATAGAAGDGSLNTSTVAGGLFILNDVDVTNDGVIVGCNLTTGSSAAAPFNCYRWDTEAAAPVPILSYSLTSLRLGDKITVTGSMSDNTATIWAVAGGATTALRFTTADNGATFTPTAFTFAGISSNSPGAYPDPKNADQLWINGNGINPRLHTISTGALVGQVSGAIVSTGSNAIVAVSTADSSYIATFSYEGTGVANPSYSRIVNVTPDAVANTTGPANAYLWSRTPSLVGVGNVSGIGDTDVRMRSANTYTVYTLNTNNGMNAVTTKKAGLPVELSAFTAAADGGAAVLRWTTESETNNSGFAIETLRGATWTERAFVSGRGTTSERMSYEQRIDGLAAGTHTFRLVQRDLDGTATIAGTVEVAIGMEAAIIAEGRGASVRFGARDAGTLTAEAFDVTGRRVAVLFAGSVDGGEMREATLSGVASGVYFVRVAGRSGAETARVVVR